MTMTVKDGVLAAAGAAIEAGVTAAFGEVGERAIASGKASPQEVTEAVCAAAIGAAVTWLATAKATEAGGGREATAQAVGEAVAAAGRAVAARGDELARTLLVARAGRGAIH